MHELLPSSTNDEPSASPPGAERLAHFRDVAPALEFCCWIIVILAPLLRWVNGAAVSDDQFGLQTALFAAAVVGAVSLRIYLLRAGRSARK
jgi:hypothetical protein